MYPDPNHLTRIKKCKIWTEIKSIAYKVQETRFMYPQSHNLTAADKWMVNMHGWCPRPLTSGVCLGGKTKCGKQKGTKQYNNCNMANTISEIQMTNVLWK